MNTPDAITHRLVEAEIVLRFGRDLPARREFHSHESILGAIGSVHVTMELVDTRLADPQAAGSLWRLADNLLISDVLPHRVIVGE